MIYSLDVRDPKRLPGDKDHYLSNYWNKAPLTKGRNHFEFKPDFNVLFAENGSGKSTLMTALRFLGHCYHTNMPRVSRDSILAFARIKGGVADGLLMEHDGAPIRYLGQDHLDVIDAKFVKRQGVDLAVEKDLKTRAMHQLSSGQARLVRMQRFLQDDPVLRWGITEKKAAALGDDWLAYFRCATESLKNVKPRKGLPKQNVVLLDEADVNLDFTRQKRVWDALEALVAKGKHQVIIASHSPFALARSLGAHVIETRPGYYEEVRANFEALFAPPKTPENTKEAA